MSDIDHPDDHISLNDVRLTVTQSAFDDVIAAVADIHNTHKPQTSLPASGITTTTTRPRAASSNPSEFNAKGRSCPIRCFVSWEREFLNLHVAVVTLLRHLWSPETLLCLIVAMASTLFCTLYEFAPGEYLASRLDFTFLGTAIIFPVTFRINETFRRRELALHSIAQIKSLSCQIQVAMLAWRWPSSSSHNPDDAWKSKVAGTLEDMLKCVVAVLKLPNWSANRHMHTAQGRAFRISIVKRQRELSRRIIIGMYLLHKYSEDLKSLGLTASECSRLNQYTYLLQSEFESLLMLKTYRTTNVARSFVRIMSLVCPAFYGPYFAWVARDSNIHGWEGVIYSSVLSLITTLVLQGLVKVQRALEDPFVSSDGFTGEVIALDEELDDVLGRLSVIREMHRGGGSGGE